MNKIKKLGVSLPEVLAVIIILGIITAIAVPCVGAIINSSRKKAVAEDVNQIATIASDYAMSDGTGSATVSISTLLESETKTDINYNGAVFNKDFYFVVEDGKVVSINDLDGVTYTKDSRTYKFETEDTSNGVRVKAILVE